MLLVFITVSPQLALSTINIDTNFARSSGCSYPHGYSDQYEHGRFVLCYLKDHVTATSGIYLSLRLDFL